MQDLIRGTQIEKKEEPASVQLLIQIWCGCVDHPGVQERQPD